MLLAKACLLLSGSCSCTESFREDALDVEGSGLSMSAVVKCRLNRRKIGRLNSCNLFNGIFVPFE